MAIAVSGCGGGEATRTQPVAAPAPAAESVIEVYPLQSSAVEELQTRAEGRIVRDDLEGAEALLLDALALADADPALWQRVAEVRLARGNFQGALEAAQQSFALGPQVGPLCERNWETIAEAQRAMGWATAAAASAEQGRECAVRGRQRL